MTQGWVAINDGWYEGFGSNNFSVKRGGACINVP